MIEVDYKPVLENNTYNYINVVSSAGIIIERFTCKDKMSASFLLNGEHIGENIPTKPSLQSL
jgi:hypothetical protein